MLQQGALVGEGEVEREVAGILPVPHLPQEVRCALRPLRGVGALPRLPPLHLCSVALASAPGKAATCAMLRPISCRSISHAACRLWLSCDGLEAHRPSCSLMKVAWMLDNSG